MSANPQCQRPCYWESYGLCGNPPKFKHQGGYMGDDCPFCAYAPPHSEIDRDPEMCPDFAFMQWKVKRCEDCVQFTTVKHYRNFILVGGGIGCKLATEWWAKGVCDKYKRIWWKFWRLN